MNYLSTEKISVLLLLLGILMAVCLAMLARPAKVNGILLTAVAASFPLVLGSHPLFSGLFERLMYQAQYRPDSAFREVVENRNGVIAVDENDVVYGGGIYDGAFKIDPLNDTNNIFRAFAVAAIHPNPRHVMVIGLSSGSWTQVLVNNQHVQETTVVEINPGYLPLIRQRPIVASLLRNPKVHIEIDDGRRWLVAHPEARFDLILMNTTFHWRANNTNLLSVEFLQLARKHLNPGGVLYYNTTNSARVQMTGASVFPFALRIANFIAVSDSPIRFDRETFRKVLESYRIDGRQVFDLSDAEAQHCIDRWVSMPESEQKSRGEEFEATIEDRASLVRRLQGERLITDDNMGTEWE
jgi:spermidine synthase